MARGEDEFRLDGARQRFRIHATFCTKTADEQVHTLFTQTCFALQGRVHRQLGKSLYKAVTTTIGDRALRAVSRKFGEQLLRETLRLAGACWWHLDFDCTAGD